MILLIDNYDSFSYNLFQLVGEIEQDIRVIRNDEMTVEEIRNLKPDRIILSPGPGRPEDAGVIMEVVKSLGKDIPIRGVCLGHQAICAAFGADARQTVTGDLRYSQPIVSGVPKTGACCPVSFSGCSGGNHAGMFEGNCKNRGWRGNGGRACQLPGLRGTVPSGIHHDAGWQTDAKEFYQGMRNLNKATEETATIQITNYI